MSKARHARPSKASRAVKTAGTAAIPGITTVILAMPAQAATAPHTAVTAVASASDVITNHAHVLDKVTVLDRYTVRSGRQPVRDRPVGLREPRRLDRDLRAQQARDLRSRSDLRRAAAGARLRASPGRFPR